MKPKPHLACILPIVCAISSPITYAADGTWSATTGGNWSDGTKWTGGIIADGATFTANLTSNITANNTLVTVDGARTLGNIVLSDAGANGSTWLVVGSPLTLDGTNPTITATTGAWISSNIGGSAGLIKAGAQPLTLTGFHTFTGPTTINGGTLILGTWGTLGGGSYADNIDITSGTFSFTSHANQTLSGVISGSGALSKATGGGKLTISNASNLLSGATTVSAGTLNLTGTLGSSALAVNAGGTLTGTGSTTGNIIFANTSGILLNASGAVQGASVTATSSTFVFVNEAPTGSVVTRDVIRYTGTAPATDSFTTNYRSGVYTDTGTKITLAYLAEEKTWNSTTGGNWDNLGSANWTGGSDGEFFWGDSVTFGGTDTQIVNMLGLLAPSSTTVNNSAGTITFAAGTGSSIIGGGGLTKSGAGNLIINGAANSYKGATVVNGGTLSLRATTNGQLPAYATSSVSVGNSATLELIEVNDSVVINTSFNRPISLANGATLKHSPTSGALPYYTVLSHTLTVAGNTTISAPTVNAATTGNFSGLFLDGGLKGSGTLTINGGNAGNGVVFRDNVNSDLKSDFTGTIIVNGVPDGNVDAGSGISVRGAQLALRNANIEVNGTMDLGGNTGDNNIAARVSAMNWGQGGTGIVTIGALTGSGVVASNNGSSTLIVGNNNTGGDFPGTLVNGTATGAPSVLNLTKIGSGTQTLSGDNSFTGTTTIDSGTLRLNSQNALKASTFNTLSSGTLVFGSEVLGNAFTVGGLSGTGNLALVNSGAVAIELTVSSNSDATYPGQFSGSGSLVKAGPGALTLSASSNHSGTTMVNAGRLNLTGSLPNSALSLEAGGSLGGEGSAKSITLNDGTLFVDPATPGTLTATNGLSITAPVAVSLSAPPAGPGPIALLHYSGTFTGNLADFTYPDTRSNIVTDTAGTIAIDLGAANRTWGGATGNWEIGGSATNWVEGDQQFYTFDTVSFPNPAGPKIVTLNGTLQPTSTTVTNSTGNDYTFSGGNLTGIGGITKNGTGTLVINNGAHSYTGATVVNDGVLQYQGSITNHATTYSGAGTVRIAVLTSGAFNTLAVLGSSFTGLLDVTGDLNMVAHPGFANNLGDLGVAAARILQVNGSTLQFDTLSGSGGILNTAGSTSAPATIRFGANNGSGTFAGSFTSINSSINGLIHLVKNGTGTQTLAGTVNGGNGTVTVNGGTLVMSATGNNIAGAFAVNGGTLMVNGTKTGAGAVTVATTATLGGSGSIAGATTIQSGGTLAPGNTTGNLTFTSTVDLQAGSTYVAEIASGGNDKITASGTLTVNGTVKVTLVGGYSPATGTIFDLADATIAPASTPTFDFSAAVLPAGLSWNTSSFATNGTISVTATPADPFNAWATTNSIIGGKGGDDDNDGVKNLLEFATAANPKNGSSGARAYPRVHTIGGQKVLTYTVATRAGTTFVANGSKQQADKDNLRYVIEASDQFGTWNSVVVTELSPADASAVQAALSAQLGTLDPAWQWHSFRTDGDVTSDPGDFIRLNVTDIP